MLIKSLTFLQFSSFGSLSTIYRPKLAWRDFDVIMSDPDPPENVDAVEPTLHRLKAECKEIWRDLDNIERELEPVEFCLLPMLIYSVEMQFFWPLNTPLEVHELVGPER